MAHDKSTAGQGDRSRINANEDYEVQYWAEKYSVTADQLRRGGRCWHDGDRRRAISESEEVSHGS